MNTVVQQIITLEHHCLQLRYSHLRALNHQVIEKLMVSIEQYGQLKPVVVIPETMNQWVLIDGYHRVTSSRALGQGYD